MTLPLQYQIGTMLLGRVKTPMSFSLGCHCEERSDVAIRNPFLETDSHGCYAASE